MYWENLEPRKTLWAVAEVAWKDSTGVPHRLPAILEDTSASGACIRVKSPITIGSTLTVKWHREQFSGVARNLRRHGTEFFLGIQRDTASHYAEITTERGNQIVARPVAPAEVIPSSALQTPQPTLPAMPPSANPRPDTSHDDLKEVHLPPVVPAPSLIAALTQNSRPAPQEKPIALPAPRFFEASVPRSAASPAPNASQSAGKAAAQFPSERHKSPVQKSSRLSLVRRLEQPIESSSPRPERKVMQNKNFLSRIWPRHEKQGTSDHLSPTEVPVNKSDLESTAPVFAAELLSSEDIYRAAGIVSPHSDYGVSKIVDMLTSKHIRDLSKDVKRASVLMALDAAGTTVDHILQDAARRQHALNSYESAQQKQFDEFEGRKTKENVALQLELERLTAHYNDRIKNNLDQVTREKEALRTWQQTKEQECQRISEAVALCSKQPPAEPASDQALKAEARPQLDVKPEVEPPAKAETSPKGEVPSLQEPASKSAAPAKAEAATAAK